MPTADPFTALGAGNGFPSCLTKVHVDDYDHWTTLSGVNKDSPATSDALIRESLKLAMMIYWNIASVNCEAKANNLTSEVSIDGDILLKKPTGYTYKSEYDALDPLTPVERVCDMYKFTLYDNSESFFRAVRAMVCYGIVAMYNEGEFVGYGSGRVEPNSGTPNTGTASVYAQWGGYCGVHLGGYMNESSSSNILAEYGYKAVSSNSNTFHFCAAATARSSTGGNFYYDATASINPLTARSTFRRTTNDEIQADAEVTFNSIDFYTY
jgi:hypothetical protein